MRSQKAHTALPPLQPLLLCLTKTTFLLEGASSLKSRVSSIRQRASGIGYAITTYYYYLITRGGSLKKIAKNIIPKVPTNKKV